MSTLQDRQVYEEHIICQNCKSHYTQLFESSQRLHSGRLGPVTTRLAESAAQQEALRRQYLYANPREIWRPCPSCGYVQSWMVLVGRSLRLRDARLVVWGASLPLAGVALARFGFALAAGNALPPALLEAICLLGGFALLATFGLMLYRRYLHREWNPNRDVQPASYEAVRAVDVDPTRSEVAKHAYVRAVNRYRRRTRPQRLAGAH